MIFCGMSCRFSTKNEQQYEAIGKYWDCFSEKYGRKNLRGLGYNWTEDSIEYVIGLKNQDVPIERVRILEQFPNAVYKEILLPDAGWMTYNGETENLSEIYAEIYQDGPLDYEIEAFTEEGECELQIWRAEIRKRREYL